MAEIQYLEINDITRMINVPANLLLGVREDKDVKKLYFKCKKIVEENVDLSKHQIYVKYINALDKSGKKFDIMDPKICLCGDVTTQGDYITFSWLMSENVFAKAGLIAFSILASDGENTRWNTYPAIGTVLNSVPGGLQEIAGKYPDIITQLLNRMHEVEKIATKETMQEYVNTYLAEHQQDKISYRVVGKIAVLPETGTEIACTGIVINTTELLMSELGKTEQLTTTVTPSNTTDVISWKSSNVDVATVTNTGLVKAVGYGTAEITVTCGTQTAICHVDVKQTEVEVISDKIVIPDSHNTGVESGIQLKEINTSSLSGVTRLQVTQQVANNLCDSDGVISNYHFNGIYVDFNKTITQTVTFRNCKFMGDDKIAYAVAVSAYGTDKGIIFENCEFSHYKSAVSSGTWKATFDKCYVHDMMQDAFKINHSDIYLKNSYIRSLGIDTTSHADGAQIENNTAEVTVHIYNCRFDQPYTSGNTENAAVFAKCKDTNIILDVQKCHATGGNYTIYALDGETTKVSGKVECVVGCSSRYGIVNIADGVEQNVVSASSLLVSTVQNGKLYVTNYTNKERILKIVTDTGEKTVTIPKSPTYDENHTQEFSAYPYNVAVEYPAGASWVKCYENDNLIRTQKLGE